MSRSEDSEDERSGLGSIEGDGDTFQYTEEGTPGAGSPALSKPGDKEPVQNQPHDEAMELDEDGDESSVDSPASATQGEMSMEHRGDGDEEQVENQPFDEAVDISDDESVQSEETGTQGSPPPKQSMQESQNIAQMDHSMETPTHTPGGNEESSGSDSSSDDEGDPQQQDPGQAVFEGVEGGYDPKDFEDLEVSDEVKGLFDYISRYNPQKVELEPTLQPFIPDYIPSVGDIDAFIKLPRPDGVSDQLGITVLDEPALVLSDPGVIEMQLRHSSKKLNLGDAVVRTIEAAEKNPKAIRSWITSISELHSKKPPTEVTYSRPMPDIESLMQVWPPQFEDELSRCQLPPKDLDVSLEDYVRIVCAIFDIPVYNNLTESLHVFFTLYSEFKNNDHFRNEMDAAAQGVVLGSPTAGMGASMGYGSMNMMDTMGGFEGDPGLQIGGNSMSPVVPKDERDFEVAHMGDEINPPPVSYHQPFAT